MVCYSLSVGHLFQPPRAAFSYRLSADIDTADRLLHTAVTMITLRHKTGVLEINDETARALQVKWAKKNVAQELALMHLWLEQHESRRPANVWRFVDNWLKKAYDVRMVAPTVAAWWATDERTINQGAALGLSARPGESMQQYRSRIAEKMRQSEGGSP